MGFDPLDEHISGTLEDSPSYAILNENGLLTTKYRLQDAANSIQTRSYPTTICNNWVWRIGSCCCCLVGGLIHRCVVKEVEVPQGHIQSCDDGRGGFFFLGPGLHRITDPYITVHKLSSLNDPALLIRNGIQTIVVVEQGKIGVAFDKGQPILLPPGLHQWQSDTLRFDRHVDLNNAVIPLGPFTLLTVDEGYSAVTQNNGRMAVLPGGKVHFLTHRNWKFEKFMSEKIQTDTLEAIEASSADNVLMLVNATVNWQVSDVETAARFSAETMKSDGQDVTGTHVAGATSTPKLKKDVMMQATASLSAFIGTVNYSDSFGISAAETMVGSSSEAAPLFDLRSLSSSVDHANEITQRYGVKIISINIIGARPADRALVNELAQGAVSAAQAQQAETAARGEAKAAEIRAQGRARAAVMEAKGDAEAEQIRADGAKKAADKLATSEVAVMLAKLDKTAGVLSGNSSFFFNADQRQIESLMANPQLVHKPVSAAPDDGL